MNDNRPDSIVVEFTEKPFFQNKNCIGIYAPWDCKNESLFVTKGGTVTKMGVFMQVRCCADERCKALAVRLARDGKGIWEYEDGELFSG